MTQWLHSPQGMVSAERYSASGHMWVCQVWWPIRVPLGLYCLRQEQGIGAQICATASPVCVVVALVRTDGWVANSSGWLRYVHGRLRMGLHSLVLYTSSC